MGERRDKRAWFRRRWRSFAIVAAGLVALPILVLQAAFYWIGPVPMERASPMSATVLDRNGNLLRAFTTPDGRWRLPAEIGEVDKRYIDMLLAYEDRRFRWHPGVDPLATGRAILQIATRGRIVSGSSTLSMQVARLIEGEHGRTAGAKLKQMLRALQLERRLTKDEILTLYLRLAPFGGNLEGVRAASWAYFGKEPRRLSIGEAALLVALPQAPGTRRPDRFSASAKAARSRVLERAAEAGVISSVEASKANGEPVPTGRGEFPKLAPHLSEAEVARRPDVRVHRLTIDGHAQASLEALARGHTRALGGRLSSAILVVDHKTGEVIAHVGSADYFDEQRLGAIDMTQAVRSPGSTLKPFIYALGFEDGLIHPETLIEDRPARFGNYSPKNFDEDFHGTVTIREALAQSLNIPAIKVLNVLGPARLVARVRRVGVQAVLAGDGEATLAIGLGGVGLRLRDLVQMYAAIANGGTAPLIDHVVAAKTGSRVQRTLLTPQAAWYVTDILKDAPPPPSAVGGRIAYKTGTSYGYRDAWAVGYDGRHTIAVWVGRADGSSTAGLTGRLAAAPLLFDAFQRVAQMRSPLQAAPAGVLRVSGGQLPQPLKRFVEAGESRVAGAFLDPPVQIAFPPDRSEVEVAGGDIPIVLKAEGGALPLTWMVDGAPIPERNGAREIEWQPDGHGFVRLSVIDAKGRVDRVTVRVR